MPMIQVEPPIQSTADGVDRLRAAVRVRQREHELWFAAPAPIASSVEPFFDLALPVAMKLRLPLQCDAPISARLATSINAWQAAMAARNRDLSPVPVRVEARVGGDPAPTPEGDGRGVGAFFSGGVDSFHTLLANRDRITHLVFVHGFDIPVTNQTARDIALGSARQVAEALGKRLIVVETNLRGFGDPLVNWGHHLFGAAAAAVCHLLSPQLKAIYIAGENVDPGAPVASTNELDPLWATENATLIHHGDDRSRFGKLTALADQPLAQQHLRVCWANVEGRRNCCRCSKCMRNMAGLRALGVLDRFTAFAEPLDLNALACLQFPREWGHVTRGGREMLDYARTQGKDPELIRALSDYVNQRYHGCWINRLRWKYWRLRSRLGRRSA